MRKSTIAGVLLTCGTIITIGWQMGVQGLPPTAVSVSATPSAPASQTPADTTSAPATTAAPTSAPSQPAASTPTASTQTSTPASTQTVTVTGDSESTRYGNVQVSVTFSGKTITDVTALQLTDIGQRSVMISDEAAPMLKASVLKAQSAKVDMVSGATYTSEGYLQSVQSAIDKHNA